MCVNPVIRLEYGEVGAPRLREPPVDGGPIPLVLLVYDAKAPIGALEVTHDANRAVCRAVVDHEKLERTARVGT